MSKIYKQWCKNVKSTRDANNLDWVCEKKYKIFNWIENNVPLEQKLEHFNLLTEILHCFNAKNTKNLFYLLNNRVQYYQELSDFHQHTKKNDFIFNVEFKVPVEQKDTSGFNL